MPGRGHQHQVGGIEQQDTGSVDLEFSRHLLSYDAKCFVKAQPAGDCAIDSPLGREAVQPSLAGLSSHHDTQLYVSRGAGFWGPPVRVGAPPDISVLTLSAPA